MTVTTIEIEGLDTLELRMQGATCIRIHTLDTTTPCHARNIVHTEIDHQGTDFILGGDGDGMECHCMEGCVEDDVLDGGTTENISDEELDDLIRQMQFLRKKKWG